MTARDQDFVAQLEQLYRRHSSQMLAYLYSLSQDFELAQEIWHETFVEAMQRWQKNTIHRPGGGLDSPAAWFKRIAKNKFIDGYRQHKMSSEKVALIKSLSTEAAEEMHELDFGDEQLKLIFTCCHPALDFDKQVALTLNSIGGLNTEQVADALLLNTKTLEQRLTRAKRKIKQAGIPFVIPDAKNLPQRLGAVLKTLYLMYNTGAQGPHDPYQLAHNAMTLVRRLTILLPHQAETEGMLALMLFHQARQDARFDENTNLIKLSEQNRQMWSKELIQQADELLKVAMQRGSLGVYQLQAAIQGVHCQAVSYSETDWQQIEALYRVHLTLDDSPVVRLNAIFAISMSRGLDSALGELRKLESHPRLQQYPAFYVLKADFAMRLKQWHAAIEHLLKAKKYTSHHHEKAHFQQMIQNCHKQLAQ